MEPAVSVKRLTRLNGEGSTKAYADIAVEEHFLVKGLRVMDGKNGLFVSMPRQKRKDGQWYDTVETLTKPAKAAVDRVVLEAYQQDATPA